MKSIASLALLSLILLSTTASQAAQRKNDHLVYLDQSVEYDSNVITPIEEISTEASDVVFGTTALIDLSVIPKTVEKYDARLSYLFLQFLHDDFSSLDFRYYEPAATLWHHGSAWSLYARGGYVLTQQNRQDLYDGALGEIGAETNLSQNCRLALSYQAGQQDFEPAVYEGRDALKHRLQAKLKRVWLPDRARWTFTGRSDFNDADLDSFTYWGLEGQAGLEIYEWPPRMDWDFSAGFRHRNYQDIYPGESEDREDERLTVSLEASYPLFRDIVFISARAEYLKNFSNLSPFDYDEWLIGIHTWVIL